MTTTSPMLTDELKARAPAAAQQLGLSPHAFIVEALAARSDLLKSGRGFDAVDVHAWLHAHAAGLPARKPQDTPWRD